jgi:hypothetical protein
LSGLVFFFSAARKRPTLALRLLRLCRIGEKKKIKQSPSSRHHTTRGGGGRDDGQLHPTPPWRKTKPIFIDEPARHATFAGDSALETPTVWPHHLTSLSVGGMMEGEANVPLKPYLFGDKYLFFYSAEPTACAI